MCTCTPRHCMLHTATAALLLHPSSAASERVFSLLSNCFSKRQDSSLSDYVEASNVINGDSVSVLLHVFGYNIENNSGIIGTKLWE